MNTAQITQFMTIVKHMNLSRAARELYITQPGLSLSVSRLEKELGVSLFIRDGNKLSLSDQGEILLSSFERLQSDYTDLLNDIKVMNGDSSSPVVIGFMGSPIQFSSFYMTGFLNQYNDTQLNKVFADPEVLESMLLNSQIDLAITYPPLEGDRIGTIEIAHDPIVVMASASHPLALREEHTISLGELENEKIFTLGKQFHMRKAYDSVFEKIGFFPNYYGECNYESYHRTISEHRWSDDLLTFACVSGAEGVFSEGFVPLTIRDYSVQRITAVSWLSERQMDRTHKGLVDYVIRSYKRQRTYAIEINRQIAALF